MEQLFLDGGYQDIGFESPTGEGVLPVGSQISTEITFDAFTADQNDLNLPSGISFRMSTDGVDTVGEL
jgi:hypothetical protein